MHDVDELLVLHTLRVAGVVETDVLVARMQGRSPGLESTLRRYEAAGLVTRHAGALAGWSLTTAGRARGEDLSGRELEALGARPVVEVAYDGFLDLNPGVLGVCTDWQVVAGSEPRQLNDHMDAGYDRAVLERLGEIHLRATDLLGHVAATLTRFESYEGRLSDALALARSGGVDWVTRPVIDSYHTVWFELHEDFLATLGRSRTDERGPRHDDTARTDRAPTGPTRQGERR